jgi:hypothetical protein
VVLTNGDKIVVVPIPDIDRRLLQSEYYLKRKAFYDEHQLKYKEWHFRIEDTEIDFELSDEEEMKLSSVLKEHDGNVANHGWYDAYHMGWWLGPGY